MTILKCINSVCVINRSCRAIHAEVYNRDGCATLFGLVNKCFSKKVPHDSKECCDSHNHDCYTGTANDALYWIDCDTDSRKTKGFGQAVVACAACNIIVYNEGLIAVEPENKPGQTIAVYACKNMDNANKNKRCA
ncbi:unnamed protein product [Rotaria sp. Silwood2]|nr:unnamed protein product [Rotaria sp. Silwood2]CAF3093987.1 unnamed protein product [Rotaria sp. Silwood2]CAF3204529.1 unnamed protein product [Rotaria sp. Silwood2]CAF4051708.1 unnamed protein product [Rotaria sp. Silwood2]CAF4166186.1 unnamed protein product [Rotaria sp. Silwood2]